MERERLARLLAESIKRHYGLDEDGDSDGGHVEIEEEDEGHVLWFAIEGSLRVLAVADDVLVALSPPAPPEPERHALSESYPLVCWAIKPDGSSVCVEPFEHGGDHGWEVHPKGS